MEMLEWDARSYDALPLPHEHWGATAIAQLRLNGDETVLALGCGTGRDAEHLRYAKHSADPAPQPAADLSKRP